MSTPGPGAGEAQMQAFAGIDASKVGDVVSAVWDQRDEIATVVAFVREHGDDLVALAARLPELLASAAVALADAAHDARSAADFLTGGQAPAPGASLALTGATTSGAGGVKAVAHLAGEALDACRRELAAARAMLDDLAGDLEHVPIPSVEPTYSKIMGQKIVTGLEFGDGRLLEPASHRLRDGAARFEGVGDRLADVAEHLRSIGGLVDRAGDALAHTAAKLESGGEALARFASH